MYIYCCECRDTVFCKLVDGSTIYPHRTDLAKLPFWQCPNCSNYVGCHHKTKDRTKPLGVIPTPAIRAARQQIHAIIDPLWKRRLVSRKWLYRQMDDRLCCSFHTAHLKDMAQINAAIEVAKSLAEQIISRNRGRQ